MAVAKAIAIIAMVVGHAEAPISNFIYTWHMPLFFMAAGYFFSEKWLDDPWGFMCRRFSKLYVPFLKWSLLFLVLHNLWFHLGILNEQFGNWTGGVTHPYTMKVAMYRLVAIFTSMSGYDEFMAGAFWFFRGLLVSSILFLVFYRLLRRGRGLGADVSLLLICAGCVAFVALRLAFGIKLSFYPNGGWRETWGIFFFAFGVLFRRWEARFPLGWYVLLAGLVVMYIGGHLHWCGMNNGARYRDLWSLPVTGGVGFVCVYIISRWLVRRNWAGVLEYVGNNTMTIFVFHIVCYKFVSPLKIWWYGLDAGQIGCHMVIHYRNDDFFWVLYSIAGVCIPLAVAYGVKRLRMALPGVRAYFQSGISATR